LYESLTNQLEFFKERLELQKAELHHVKAHGALYNQCYESEEISNVLLSTIREVFDSTKLYAPFNSVITDMAMEYNLEVIHEGFADRNYTDDVRLVSRKHPKAIINNSDEVLSHVKRMVRGEVLTVSGNLKPIKAKTFCIHGDHSASVKILTYLHENM